MIFPFANTRYTEPISEQRGKTIFIVPLPEYNFPDSSGHEAFTSMLFG